MEIQNDDVSSECEQLRFEMQQYRSYILELKQKVAVYVPVKSDIIDKKIAEFVNSYPVPSKLKVMFTRESEGVYTFGTKKVTIKVIEDRINIRVGGGYLSIEEFLDQYTPLEVEKLERKDPLRKATEKIAVNRSI